MEPKTKKWKTEKLKSKKRISIQVSVNSLGNPWSQSCTSMKNQSISILGITDRYKKLIKKSRTRYNLDRVGQKHYISNTNLLYYLTSQSRKSSQWTIIYLLVQLVIACHLLLQSTYLVFTHHSFLLFNLQLLLHIFQTLRFLLQSTNVQHIINLCIQPQSS